jgi:hypothetical protein
MGLAIAAIPISVLMGALCLLVVAGSFLLTRVLVQAKDQLPRVLSLDATELAQPDSILRQLCSESFNQEVDAEALEAWLTAVKDKQGKLVEVKGLSPVQPSRSSGKRAINLEGKFVNGPANITITFAARGFDVKIDDIEIDGISPRGRD